VCDLCSNAFQEEIGDDEYALSAITVVELTHGAYRAASKAQRDRRQSFCEELYRDAFVYPVSLSIAQLAGRVEGEQASKGNSIATADLLIGVTALSLGFAVGTLNVRHFQRIPRLKVIEL
jgi:predicted nucleic acid-binding protein